MNNSATTFRISKLEQSISDLNEKLDRQNDMLKDLAQLLAPSFAQSCDSYFSSDILEASQQGRHKHIILLYDLIIYINNADFNIIVIQPKRPELPIH